MKPHPVNTATRKHVSSGNSRNKYFFVLQECLYSFPNSFHWATLLCRLVDRRKKVYKSALAVRNLKPFYTLLNAATNSTWIFHN